MDPAKAKEYVNSLLRRYEVSDWVSARFDGFDDPGALFPDTEFRSVIVIVDQGTAWIGLDGDYVSDPQTDKRGIVVALTHQIAHFWNQDDAHGNKWSRSFRGLLKRAPFEKHFHYYELNEISRRDLGSRARCIYDEWPE